MGMAAGVTAAAATAMVVATEVEEMGEAAMATVALAAWQGGETVTFANLIYICCHVFHPMAAVNGRAGSLTRSSR